MPIDLICLDADDTLWHNMRFFGEAQAAFAGIVAPFVDAGIATETLERCEVRNLALYGYGAKSFTLSMIETAVELGDDDLPAAVVRDILAAGRTLLSHPVELFDGIADTLAALARRARLVLVTKGDLLHQEGKLAASGLGAHFAGVEIVSEKDEGVFRRLFDRHGVAPEAALMAGDSMRSDVLPALAAGAWGVFIPQDGGWAHERGRAPDDHPRYRTLASLAELPALVDVIAAG
ncbi:HAD family hydrolase [Sphingomonas rubra]|uniref:Putative hydrolase of the HAD superfamily n=1 Tax=Sphingomonas rubra TaxID=634430 RepID=A0A1I5UF63_9SPHN|nr:HAD family hydrolase [Sphingomonas rubra]SFP93895.1 putative hydrolase of the HAD superfamily [Sphingomonas rubra]